MISTGCDAQLEMAFEAALAEQGLAGEWPPEALDEEEDARWSYLPFLQLAVERMCVMTLLAEERATELGAGALPALRRHAGFEGDPVFVRAADDYLAALATLASMSGRAEDELHGSVAGFYLGRVQ
ncbi:hypothetical protein CXB49_11845 [Chromobacterium sp. ATCC 53434]|uniref:hypothetical protein n=1 Tax=Chromobacterium TaxID=535 RepID=UPI000C7949E6|nr:hypothetical protein [Chromobacterium sp. ATCC 53434]AUH51461.1 hypothetical protein CXB49_11845 [Chromobacterium sp. ATCC 53434]